MCVCVCGWVGVCVCVCGFFFFFLFSFLVIKRNVLGRGSWGGPLAGPCDAGSSAPPPDHDVLDVNGAELNKKERLGRWRPVTNQGRNPPVPSPEGKGALGGHRGRAGTALGQASQAVRPHHCHHGRHQNVSLEGWGMKPEEKQNRWAQSSLHRCVLAALRRARSPSGCF